MKQIKLFNHVTHSTNLYILVESTKDYYLTVLPITYYWLKYIDKLEFIKFVTTEFHKCYVSVIGQIKEENLEQNEFFNNKYSYAYETIDITKTNIKYLNSISLFIEHFDIDFLDESILHKLERSLINTNVTIDYEFINLMGTIINCALRNKNIEIKKEDRLELLLSSKLFPYYNCLSFID